ncbi:hypothetical protein PISL3812_04794 [Talaromyces islandicus]|uniref:G domain-containing protein n=1 Tax=Talaromyces islandicus TaxID=28573 RepID=A0A0U1LWJ3_TALIS|nr:hypothetical protein PISL3812_04794 [Talaromyces islandicus]
MHQACRLKHLLLQQPSASPLRDARGRNVFVSRVLSQEPINHIEIIPRSSELSTPIPDIAIHAQTTPESSLSPPEPADASDPPSQESPSSPTPPASISLHSDVLPVCCPGCGAYSQTIEPADPGYYDVSRRRVKKLWGKAQHARRAQAAANQDDTQMDKEVESETNAEKDGAVESQDESATEIDTMAATEFIQASTLPSQICDRCHDLLYHNKGISAPSPTIDSIAAYLEESPHNSNRVYHIVDAADFPMSLISGIYDALELQGPKSKNRRARTEKYKYGKKMTTISFVITRSDLLAATKEQVDSLMQRVRSIIMKAMRFKQEDVRLGSVHMISAHRGWWTTQVKEEIRKHGGGIWVVGKTNVGKSNFIESCFPKDSKNVAKITELFQRRKEEEKGLGAKSVAGDAFSDPLPDQHVLNEDSLLPPAPREELFPTFPVISSLPGTTVSPIRIPFGRGHGEMIDLPGLDRSTLPDFVLDQHKVDLVMTKRVNPAEQLTILDRQSLLIGGGLIRITPVAPEGCTILAACFVPLETHVTRTDKAIEVQKGLRRYNTGGGDRGTSIIKPEFLLDETIQSAGTFTLSTNVTTSHLPSIIKKKWDDHGVKPDLNALPYRVFSTDILIEGCGWIELTGQIRTKDLSANGLSLPRVEIFSPLGKHVSARPSLEIWNFIRDKRKADKRKGQFTSGSHRPRRQSISHKKRTLHGGGS